MTAAFYCRRFVAVALQFDQRIICEILFSHLPDHTVPQHWTDAIAGTLDRDVLLCEHLTPDNGSGGDNALAGDFYI